MTKHPDLKRAQELSNQQNWDAAYVITDRHLSETPNDVDWLMLMTFIMMGTGKRAIAYSLAKRCVDLAPKDPSMYLNCGMAANDLWMPAEAERLYRRGMKIARNPEQLAKFLVNLTGVYIDNGRFEDAEEICHQIIELKPDTVKGYANLGFCQVATKQWDKGWPNYRKCIGTEWRPKMVYADEPEWDGVSRGTIVLYAEQGLGDMICFASMLPDMQVWAAENESTLVLDMDWRLHNLFQRSFNSLAIYPTAGVTADKMRPELKWKDEHCEIDYSLPMGQVAEYFRTSEDDFPRTPFLIPNKDEEYKWRSLFESKAKPAIGIAWTGGHAKTGAHLKRLTLEQLVPLFESIDATWVSLQYKPCTTEIEQFRGEYPHIDLVEYPKTTLDKDYDQTAGLVAALDAVVSVPTAVVHLAGALGVRTIAMEAPMRCWKYNAGNPFHPITAQIPHSDDWDATIEETASYLKDLELEVRQNEAERKKA
jgi:tetratricopeptide (TPR) repeat protein